MPPLSPSRRARWSVAALVALIGLPAVVSPPTAVADDEAAAAEVVVGELVQAWPEYERPEEAAEHGDEGPLSWIESETAEAVRVPTAAVEELEPGATVEVGLGAEVEDPASGEGLEPAREVLSAEVLVGAPAPPPAESVPATSLTNEITVAMVVPAGGVRDAATLGEVVAAVDGPVAEFWEQETGGSVRIGVTAAHDWITSTASCSEPYDLWYDVADQVGFVEAEGKQLLVYVTSTPPGLTGCAYGLGEVGSHPGYQGTYAYVRDVHTPLIAHEIGHLLSLRHSSSRQCTQPGFSGTCHTDEYGDYYDVMGATWDQVGSLNVVQARQLTAVSSVMLEIDSAPATVTLSPVSQRSGVRAIGMIDSDDMRWWLEFRPASGRDAYLGTSANWPDLQPGVLLRRGGPPFSDLGSALVDGTPSPQSQWGQDRDVALPVGTPVRIADPFPGSPRGFSITVESVTATSAQIRVVPDLVRSGSPLVRVWGDNSVYLLAGGAKHPVADLPTLTALSPLGAVESVTQDYLDQWPVGPRATRVVAGPGGAMYFLDAGMRLPFPSCAQVSEYGGSCATTMVLTQAQLGRFVGGPPITPLYRTTSGKAFLLEGGTKREVVDDAALVAAGLPTTGVRLLETGLGYLPYGRPVTRDGVALLNRSTGAVTVATGGTFTTVPEPVRAATALRSLPMRALDDASLRLVGATAVPTPLVRESGGTRVFLLTETGKRELVTPALAPASTREVPAAFLALLPDAGTLGGTVFVKGSASTAVYALRAGQRRHLRAFADLLAFYAASPMPTTVTIDQRLASLLPEGPAQLGPASLAVSPRSSTVFFVNGADELVPVTSFARTGELGATRLVRVPDAAIDAYAVRASPIGTTVDCAGDRYLGLGGRLHRMDAGALAHYPPGSTSLDPLACAALPKAGVLSRFLRDPNGTIFHIENGTKRPIRSYATLLALGGSAATTLPASAFALSQIPTGPVL